MTLVIARDNMSDKTFQNTDKTTHLFFGWTGDICHPNSPCSAGGMGTFRQGGPLGTESPRIGALPHPDSSVGRSLSINAITKKLAPKDNDPQVVRLREIRQLVKDNNKSTLDENVIICQIYMESRFDANTGANHDAKGLMQMQKNAVRQVYKYRKQKELGGHMPSDKMVEEIFKKADKFHASPSIFDQVTNIQLGTEYMQYCLDTNNKNIEEAYKKYRGNTNGVYYNKIKAAADKLSKNPESMQILYDMVKIEK
jgi:Transglycosylase SLT domain